MLYKSKIEVLVICCFLLCFLSMGAYYFLNSVNLFFYDQYVALEPLIEKKDFFTLFNYRQELFRMGIGYVLWDTLNSIFGIDARIPGWISISSLFFATAVALLLLKKIFGRLSFFDIVVPLMFFSPKIYEEFFGGMYPPLGPFGLLLILSFIYIYLRENFKYRRILLLLFIFLITYSGYAFLFTVTVIVFFIFVLFSKLFLDRDSYMSKDIIVIFIGAVFSLLLFFRNYHFEPGVTCFKSIPESNFQILNYASLVNSYYAGFFKVNAITLVVGYIGLFLKIVAIITAIFFKNKNSNYESKKFFESVILLSGFSILYVFAVSYGRYCLGDSSAFTSRYMAFLIPGFLSLFILLRYLHMKFIKLKRLNLPSIFFILFVIFELNGYPFWFKEMNRLIKGKKAVYQCISGNFQKIPMCR